MTRDTPALRIACSSASPGGLWRCGVQHPKGPVDHPAGTFTAEQVERLEAEPLLVVTRLDGNAPPPAGAPADGGLVDLGLGHLTEAHQERLRGMTGDEIDLALDVSGERRAAIRLAVADLVSDGDPKDRTKDGVPKVDAVERRLGFDISAAERDNAWAEIQAERAEAA